ncbi:MAG: hypothetical protein E6Q88_00460 [Lysobacteraceae bacterium]|nr:MAG: hypothetical protein E6Q88_00460 [Xanthomonadaceae bacterium]
MLRAESLPRFCATSSWAGVLAVALFVSLPACSPPEAPETERHPEPIAPSGQHGALREAIQQPIDEAKAARELPEEAARRQRAEIDAQTGG